jgi:hypothetical protein
MMTVIAACKNSKQEIKIIPADSMKVIMFDFFIANEWNNTRMADTVFLKSKDNLKAYQQVFAIHHIDKKTFDSSLSYYEQRPDVFKKLIDSVNAYGTRLRDAATPKPKPAKTPSKTSPIKKLNKNLEPINKKP